METLGKAKISGEFEPPLPRSKGIQLKTRSEAWVQVLPARRSLVKDCTFSLSDADGKNKMDYVLPTDRALRVLAVSVHSLLLGMWPKSHHNVGNKLRWNQRRGAASGVNRVVTGALLGTSERAHPWE